MEVFSFGLATYFGICKRGNYGKNHKDILVACVYFLGAFD